MQFDKRGTVSIPAFSFVLLILISIFIFSQDYYIYYTKEISSKKNKIEALNSIGTFRAQALETLSKPRANINYTNKLDPKPIKIILKNKTIKAEIIKNNYKTEINISTLGPSFCNNYEIVPKQNSILSYNNSCISVITQ